MQNYKKICANYYGLLGMSRFLGVTLDSEGLHPRFRNLLCTRHHWQDVFETKLQGSRIVQPVVLRDSRSRCACATSASG